MVLCAGAPDTPEIAREMEEGVAKVAARRPGVIWIREMLSRPNVIQLYTHAAVFCCPSVYEPFGIINLEAMACETAVVASAVGGIPEVVVPEETGLLVDVHLQPGTFDPADPAVFSARLAAAINRLARDSDCATVRQERPPPGARAFQLGLHRPTNNRTLWIAGQRSTPAGILRRSRSANTLRTAAPPPAPIVLDRFDLAVTRPFQEPRQLFWPHGRPWSSRRVTRRARTRQSR